MDNLFFLFQAYVTPFLAGHIKSSIQKKLIQDNVNELYKKGDEKSEKEERRRLGSR